MSVLHAHFRDVEPVLAAGAAAVVLPDADLPAGRGASPGSADHELAGRPAAVGQPGRAVRRGRARRPVRGHRAVARPAAYIAVAGALALALGVLSLFRRMERDLAVIAVSRRAAGEIVLEHATRSFELVHERAAHAEGAVRCAAAAAPRRRVHGARDVTLRIEPGEAVGLVGRNGAGKTSTLRCLAGIVPLDSGRAECGGRVVTLLELGAGFGPDFSGRENIYLNGALHGFGARGDRGAHRPTSSSSPSWASSSTCR